MTNVFVVDGALGRDSELRYTTNNKPVLNFSLANNTGHGDHKKTTWVNCCLFGDRAAKLNEYFLKGTKLIVDGEFTSRKWTDKDGNNRETFELFVRNFSFAGGKDSGNSGGSYDKPLDDYTNGVNSTAPCADLDDDVPF